MEHTKERRTELLLDSWRDETKFFQEIDLKPSQNCFHNSSSSILFSTSDIWLFCLEERSFWGQMASDDNPNWGNEVLEPTAPSVNQPSCPANAGTTELTAAIAEDPKNNVDEHFSNSVSLPSSNYPVQENPVFMPPDKIYCKNIVAITNMATV